MEETCNICGDVGEVVSKEELREFEPGQPCRVAWSTNPFNAEIHNDFTEMWICHRCWEHYSDEI